MQSLRTLYARHGQASYGEDISQLQHGLQCARLASHSRWGEAAVLSAFFHDLGHLLVEGAPMGNYGRQSHEQLGADYLASLGFGDEVTEPVRQHVMAKRYLASRSPAYVASLSEASRITLRYQGGALDAQSAAAFEKHPQFSLILALRGWDDHGKAPNIDGGEAAWVFELAERYLRHSR